MQAVRPLVGVSQRDGILPQISAEGRFVAFVSQSADLVEGDTNTTGDVFVRDRNNDTTVRANLLDNVAQTPTSIGEYAFSADNQWLGFWVTGTGIGTDPDWFLKNLLTNQSFTGQGFLSHVNGDGSKVTFWRAGSPALLHIFDRTTNQTTSIAPQANGPSLDGRFSRNGNFLFFYSEAGNLVANDTNNVGDIFSYRLSDGQIARISLLPGGQEPNGRSIGLRDSDDGRYLVFSSEASNLVAGDSNGVADVFVKDSVTGQISLVSRAPGGPANGDSVSPSISGDGRLITFNSKASNLVARDTNARSDVFLYNREQSALLGRVSLTQDAREGVGEGDNFRQSEISRDGNWIAFSTEANNMVSGLIGGTCNVYVTNTVIPELFTPPGPNANPFEYTLTGNPNISLEPFSVASGYVATGAFEPQANGARTVRGTVTVPLGSDSRRLEFNINLGADTLSVGDQVTLPNSDIFLSFAQGPTNGQGQGQGQGGGYQSGSSGTLTIVSFNPGPGTGGTIGIRLDNWEMVPFPSTPATGSFFFNGTLTVTLP